MKPDLGPMPPYPGRMPLLFRARAFWLVAALNVIGLALGILAAYLDASRGNDFMLAFMCLNLTVQLGSSTRLVRDAVSAFRTHRELLASWEWLRAFREAVERSLR